MSRGLLTFSTLSLVLQKKDRDVDGQDNLQNQQQSLLGKKKITIKPKVVPTPPPTSIYTPTPAPLAVASPNPEKQTLQDSESKQRPKPKIIIKKVPQVQREEEKQKNEEEKQDSSHRENKKIKITIVKRRFKYSDIAPPATMCFTPTNDLYRTPPPNCCRFFIENKQCFLRKRDSACICPTSKTVIGFWNEKVGIECKLLPVEDETTYEEATAIKIVDKTIPEEAQHSSASDSSIPSPKQKTILPMSPIPKPKFVSDAQRSRIASEPVALLRAKLAKQYGVVAKKN